MKTLKKSAVCHQCSCRELRGTLGASKEASTVKYLLTGQFNIFLILLRLVNKLSWLTWGRGVGV